jgi:hypothetical protein
MEIYEQTLKICLREFAKIRRPVAEFCALGQNPNPTELEIPLSDLKHRELFLLIPGHFSVLLGALKIE